MDDLIIKIARLAALGGTALLVFSAIGGVLLASKTAQRIPFLKGKTFKYHRLISLSGAALLVIHPALLWLARGVTSVTLPAIFIPFITAKQPLWIGLGTLAFWAMIAVVVSSVLIRRVKHKDWRALHYLGYALLVLGLAHGIPISNDFRTANPVINLHDAEKYALILAAAVVIVFPLWRAAWAGSNRRERALKLQRKLERRPRAQTAPVRVRVER